VAQAIAHTIGGRNDRRLLELENVLDLVALILWILELRCQCGYRTTGMLGDEQ
jgi:hypothetical protein